MQLRTNGYGQRGVMLLEALIAILIFSIGILGLVGMQAFSIGAISDAKYRSDASFLANEIAAQIWVDRANMANYVSPGGAAPALAIWIAKVNNELPQSAANPPVITVNAGTGVVDVTIRWQQPNSTVVRNYRAVSVIANP
jgi:type IV pilus assembly protein PilV